MDLVLVQTKLTEYLNTLPLPTLRIIGRRYGLGNSTNIHKPDLIKIMVDIMTGRMEPPPRSNRGAPAKDTYVDPNIITQIEQIRHEADEIAEADSDLQVHAGIGHSPARLAMGVLEIIPSGYGFLRAENCQPSTTGSDVFISGASIHALRLRQGDLVTCTTKPRVRNDSPAIDSVLSVNGVDIGLYENRLAFDSLTPVYPSEKIELSRGSNDLSLRAIDFFTPIGKGQRGLIIAPPKAGKTTLLKSIASAITTNYPDIKLFVLLIDERPEEVTDFRTSVPSAEVIYSTFDESPEHHIRAATLTIERAKRLVEIGKDVVVLLDSITKLTRAYNFAGPGSGKILTGGLDAAAFLEPKRFFGAARNLAEQGSLTVLATALVDTGSRMDDVVYEEFKGTGNCDIVLSRELAEKRTFPAIDLRRSGTRKEELLLAPDELDAVIRLRDRGFLDNTPGILDMLGRTEDNSEFIDRLPEWMRIYKS